MNLYISADADTLLRQAGATAETYLADAIRAIDNAFGDNFARDHPRIVAAFMKTAARDYHTAIMKAGLDNIAQAIQEAKA